MLPEEEEDELDDEVDEADDELDSDEEAEDVPLALALLEGVDEDDVVDD